MKKNNKLKIKIFVDIANLKNSSFLKKTKLINGFIKNPILIKKSVYEI